MAENKIGGGTPSTKINAYWNGDLPWIQSSDIEEGIVLKANVKKKITKLGLDKSSAKLVPEKSIAIVTRVGVGKLAYMPYQYSTSQDFLSLSNLKEDHFFLTYLLYKTLNEGANSQGTSIKGITKDYLLSINMFVPSKDEQRKIGKLFSKIDTTITLQQRKLNSLQKLKKGLLQKMFPKNGENIPEIRFPEFSDAWKQRKFSDSFDFLQNNTLSRASLNDTSGCAKSVHYGDILVKFGESISAEKADLPFICDREILKKLSKSILKNGDVVIADTAEDMTTGKSCEIVDVDECMPVLAGLHTIPVRPKQKFGKYYLGYYLNSEAFHSQLIPLIQGIKVYSISKSSIKDTVVMFPDDVQEQEKIGSLFNRIDNTITLQQRKLESLQKLKKGLLQQMFI